MHNEPRGFRLLLGSATSGADFVRRRLSLGSRGRESMRPARPVDAAHSASVHGHLAARVRPGTRVHAAVCAGHRHRCSIEVRSALGSRRTAGRHHAVCRHVHREGHVVARHGASKGSRCPALHAGAGEAHRTRHNGPVLRELPGHRAKIGLPHHAARAQRATRICPKTGP